MDEQMAKPDGRAFQDVGEPHVPTAHPIANLHSADAAMPEAVIARIVIVAMHAAAVHKLMAIVAHAAEMQGQEMQAGGPREPTPTDLEMQGDVSVTPTVLA